MKFQASLVLALAAAVHAQGSSSSAPPPGPSGVPYPDTTYPNAISHDPQVVAGSKANQTSPPKYPSPWGTGTGDWASAYAKAQAFVKQLTLLEKVNLTTGVGWQGEQCVGAVGSIPRLNFRALCMQDSPTGVRFADFVSVFPAGVNAAASWSRSLANQRGAAMGYEHRSKGVDVQLGPVAGPLGRSPEGGRNWEGFSPDPYLTGVMMKETIEGIQGQGVIACAKHYILNEQEHFRQPGQEGFSNQYSSSSNIDDKTMHETYLWPFADAVRANVGSVMCSYQQINNSYGCQNSYTQNYLLKGELGFQGFIMSDWSAQHSGVASAYAGLDMTMPGDVSFNSDTSYWGPNLTAAVLNGTVPQWRIDDMCVRIMAAWYLVGRDSKGVPVNFDSWSPNTVDYVHYYAKEGLQVVNQHIDVRNNHQQFTRKLASYSTVLLKNKNHALPLTGHEKLTGVFGEDAGSNVWGENGCPDRNCDNGTLAMGWGSGTADFASLVTPQMAILTKLIGNGRAVESILDNWATTQIQRLAGRVDTAIVFVNADSGEGYIDVDGNVGDRLNLTLWRNGDTLVKNVSALCNNTIVVVHSTGPVILDDYEHNDNVSAILWAGVPGDMSGYAIADVLYGHVNPGAKLPFTIGKKRSDFGTDLLYTPNGDPSQIQFQEGNNIDYRHFDAAGIAPTYEFGYGLSYTTFGYSNLQIQRKNARPYQPNSKSLPKAPTYGSIDNDTSHYQFPSSIHRVWNYIYPYLNSTDLKKATNDSDYGKNGHYPKGVTDGGPQKGVPAGGAPGGNPQLYDVLYTVTATITNTGKVAGDEVPQLYISLGGKYDPPRVLRGFDRITLQPGQSATFKADLTRRDVSNWDTASQNWVISSSPKTVYVGCSSRKLQLKGSLPTGGY